MTLFVNKTKDAAIASVEFTPTLDGNFSFFQVRDKSRVDEVRKTLTGFGQYIMAETTVEGTPMIITHGPRTDYTLVNELKAAGNKLTPPDHTRKFNPWKLRGWASMIGQPLQLISAALTKPKGIDGATASFATLNIIANIANISLGDEKAKDVHQLRYLKRQFNTQMANYMPGGASSALPSSYDDRMQLRGSKEAHPSLGKRCYGFIKQHSVSFCEVGLRYLGAVFLAFPLANMRKGTADLGNALAEADKNKFVASFGDNIKDTKALAESDKHGIMQTVGERLNGIDTIASHHKQTIRKAISDRLDGIATLEKADKSKILKSMEESFAQANKNGILKSLGAGAKAAFNHQDRATGYVGLAYIAGKSLALTSKIPDPYDPKPHTTVDTVREKVVFPTSSVIEAGAAGYLAYDRLFKRKIGYTKIANAVEPMVSYFTKNTPAWLAKMKNPEFKTRDWFGGVGGALFTAGLAIRVFAPFGHKEVDLNELNAHMVDGLAHVPPDKVPNLIADYSAFLTEHFKGKVQFGEVYKEIADGLYRYHQIALPTERDSSPTRERSTSPADIKEQNNALRTSVEKKNIAPAAFTRPDSYKETVTAGMGAGTTLGV